VKFCSHQQRLFTIFCEIENFRNYLLKPAGFVLAVDNGKFVVEYGNEEKYIKSLRCGEKV